MRPRLKRNLLLLLLAVAYLVTGFFREFLFVNINQRIWELYQHQQTTQIYPSLHFLTNFSGNTLYYSKWPLTLLFTAIFAAFACAIVHLLFHERKYLRWTVLAYAAVFFTGLLFAGIGALSGHFSDLYTVARFLADIVEKPVMIIILIPAFYLHRANS